MVLMRNWGNSRSIAVIARPVLLARARTERILVCIVVPVAVGSNPINHPNRIRLCALMGTMSRAPKLTH